MPEVALVEDLFTRGACSCPDLGVAELLDDQADIGRTGAGLLRLGYPNPCVIDVCKPSGARMVDLSEGRQVVQ